MKAQSLVTILLTASVLQGCTMANSSGRYDQDTDVTASATEMPATEVPDNGADLNGAQMAHCLELESDSLTVYEKINAKDALITQEFSKLQRIALRMQQIQVDAGRDENVRRAYAGLETQRKNQITRVLSLFRDREAIHQRKSFLDADLQDQCKGKHFSNSDFKSACAMPQAARSPRCQMRF